MSVDNVSPAYLNKEFFKKVLQSGFKTNENYEIDDIKLSLASSPGDNYTSTIYRAEIHYKEKSVSKCISLIVKSILQKINDMEGLEDMDVFGKEVKMYTEIIPRIEKLYNNVEQFAPKCFLSEINDEYSLLVFQDLKAIGFSVANRVKRLDEFHSKIVLRKLARYHAGTIILHEKEPELLKYFNKGFFHSSKIDNPIFKSFMTDGIRQIISLIPTWNDNEFNKYIEKLEKVLANVNIKLPECFESWNGIRVLNHSDMWTNNMMFKYENSKVSDVFLIDLQVSTNGGPGMDVNYFFNTSVCFDVLKNKREELCQYYCNELKQGLRELKYPESQIPTDEIIKSEIRNKEFFGLLIFINVAPIMMLDEEQSKDSNIDEILDSNKLNKKRLSVFTQPIYLNFLKYNLKRCDELGIFEFN